MKIFTALFLLVPALAVAWEDNPYDVFDITKKMYNKTEVEIVTSNDPSTRCQVESKKRGFGGWPYKVYACTFWGEGGRNKCTIYIGTTTNMHQLGHEFRHCFQGSFHP